MVKTQVCETCYGGSIPPPSTKLKSNYMFYELYFDDELQHIFITQEGADKLVASYSAEVQKRYKIVKKLRL